MVIHPTYHFLNVQKSIFHVHICSGSRFNACQELNAKLKTGFGEEAARQLADDFIATHGKTRLKIASYER